MLLNDRLTVNIIFYQNIFHNLLDLYNVVNILVFSVSRIHCQCTSVIRFFLVFSPENVDNEETSPLE